MPLATPLLAGPGAIATVMVLTAERPGMIGLIPIVLAVLLTFLATYFTLRGGRHIGRVLGVSGMAMFQRVMGLLLASIAIQFIVEGGRRLFLGA